MPALTPVATRGYDGGDGSKVKGDDSRGDRGRSERRRAPRVLVDLEVDYASEENYLFAYITDISATGIFVRTTTPEAPGTHLNLRFCVRSTASRASRSRARSSGSTRTGPAHPTTCTPGWGSGSSASTTSCAIACSSSSAASRTCRRAHVDHLRYRSVRGERGRARSRARARSASAAIASVVLVHVVDAEPGEQARGRRARARAAARGRARPGRAIARARRARASAPPDETLVAFAETEGADLIVIAAQLHAAARCSGSARTAEQRHRADPRAGARRARSGAVARVRARRAPAQVLLGIDDSATCDLGIQWTQALRRARPGRRRARRDLLPRRRRRALRPASASAGRPRSRDRAADGARPDAPVRRRQRRRHRRDRRAAPPRPRPHRRPHVELAREENVDAIVVGTSQKTGLGRLGSVSSVIVHDAPRVGGLRAAERRSSRPRRVPPLRAALVATDLSPFANRAVPYAFALTPSRPARSTSLHVVKEDAEVDEPRSPGAARARADRRDPAACSAARRPRRRCRDRDRADRRAARRRRRSASRRTAAPGSRARSSARSPTACSASPGSPSSSCARRPDRARSAPIPRQQAAPADDPHLRSVRGLAHRASVDARRTRRQCRHRGRVRRRDRGQRRASRLDDDPDDVARR